MAPGKFHVDSIHPTVTPQLTATALACILVTSRSRSHRWIVDNEDEEPRGQPEFDAGPRRRSRSHRRSHGGRRVLSQGNEITDAQ